VVIAHEKRGLLPLARLCAALRFLTLLPIPWRAEEDGHHFSTSLPYFILVGALIGITVAILALGGQYLLPQPVTAMLAVAVLAGVSGFLHLDGLSDSADGLLSSRSREASLAIMKDSRAGAMGIVAVVLVLLTKFAALASVPVALFPQTLFLMALGGRCAILVMMAVLPYARQEGGLGALFYCGNSKRAGLLAAVALMFSVMVVAPGQLVAVLVVLGLVLLLFCRWCVKKLGGATGDTLGAVCELAETAVAVAMTISLTPYSS
jgi:adenosylcobinamide-GDP ribazoletransferase